MNLQLTFITYAGIHQMRLSVCAAHVTTPVYVSRLYCSPGQARNYYAQNCAYFVILVLTAVFRIYNRHMGQLQADVRFTTYVLFYTSFFCHDYDV